MWKLYVIFVIWESPLDILSVLNSGVNSVKCSSKIPFLSESVGGPI